MLRNNKKGVFDPILVYEILIFMFIAKKMLNESESFEALIYTCFSNTQYTLLIHNKHTQIKIRKTCILKMSDIQMILIRLIQYKGL